MIEDGPKPAMQTTRKLAANAPVNLVIYKITDVAGDVWERYKGTQEPLWQIQLSQDSARPITYQMRDRFRRPSFPPKCCELLPEGVFSPELAW